MVKHFWDGYDFADSTLVNSEMTEQAFANYLGALAKCEEQDIIEQSITRMLDSASASHTESYHHFMELSDKYLHNPNSPLRNEEQYIVVLNQIISNHTLDDIYKIRPRAQLKMALKNRVGNEATDFEYRLRSGERGDMHEIEAPFTILFFNNPDCHDCMRVKEYISASQPLNELHAKGDIEILSVYPDSDIELWRKAHYPAIMIDAYDEHLRIERESLYDLKAIPSLYLLDEQKRVILKDAPIESIEALLKNKRAAN